MGCVWVITQFPSVAKAKAHCSPSVAHMSSLAITDKITFTIYITLFTFNFRLSTN